MTRFYMRTRNPTTNTGDGPPTIARCDPNSSKQSLSLSLPAPPLSIHPPPPLYFPTAPWAVSRSLQQNALLKYIIFLVFKILLWFERIADCQLQPARLPNYKLAVVPFTTDRLGKKNDSGDAAAAVFCSRRRRLKFELPIQLPPPRNGYVYRKSGRICVPLEYAL